ncbi:MAG: malto-oligosyltrehalose synthase [Acidobacteria bacterium]|nr:malto-oligosyltrehalose synthase [Acidobacteriota bacterium]
MISRAAPWLVPVATYRLQLNADFTFDAAAAIVDYLDRLGISCCYASNYLAAVPGSTHGYDVADPTRLNPEIGDEPAYLRWVEALRAHGMGHIMDLVPNHMGIARSANPWWQDVLENGPSSSCAPIFDIDWHPLKQELEDKVLLPVLGDPYGVVLERQEIRLEYQEGAFHVRYYDRVFPIAPGTYDRVLGLDADELVGEAGADTAEGVELLSILTAIRNLPGRQVQDPVLLAERDREKEVIKRRLAALTRPSLRVLAHIERAVAAFNGRKGDPRSFDRLDALLSAQPYRLAYWRVAAEEINYRRFFDINELAAIRMEDPAVFDRLHAFPFELVARGAVDGFRIDHVDGLFDPGDYLQRLQGRAREVRPDLYSAERPLYVIVEKILGLDEELPHWPVGGTTGYDFLARLNGLFVDQRNESAIDSVYERFTRLRAPFREIAYRGKQLVLRVSMASELNVLAHGLNRLSERNRHYRDFTLNSLAYAIREIIACFPVYRTYVNDREPVSARDRGYLEHAVREAKRRNPGHPALVFDFVRDLLLKRADYLPEEERSEHMRFVGKFQQVTSPVTAKGIEDTALYIYNRLVSLNEVGSEPDRFGVAPDEVHAWLAARAARWPHGLSATSTHDTKRSEDVRARLNVLSELPGAWKQATARWARANRRGRSIVEGQSAPSRNEEYLVYQALVGTWPLAPMTEEQEREYRGRIVAYMHKAMREAKVFTSWINPSERHEQAMTRFLDTVLSPDNTAFRDDFLEFHGRVARYGVYNSLAQLAVKVGAPGVPDFYQGTELWDFSLVDPDNRRRVDYARRRALLAELDASSGDDRASGAAQLLSAPWDDRLKLFATAVLLRFRRARQDLFRSGGYEALGAEGTRREHLFAFARAHEGRQVLVVVPRFVATLLPDADVPPLGERVWGDTRLVLPGGGAEAYRHVLTDRCVSGRQEGGRTVLQAAEIFEHFPIGVLEGTS